MQSENISKYNDCSNCGACYNICPTEAISVLDSDLYYKLNIDEKKCINCGKCINICPFNNSVDTNKSIQKAYCMYSKENDVIRKSSSGGAFYEIASYILEYGGVIWAAAFSADYKKVEISSTDSVSLEKMQKSKYVESYIGYSFKKIKESLENGITVLFCGAPCQVAGLNAYLGRDYENLITCDFTCGGFPSHMMYKKHIEALEKRYSAKTVEVDFRPKVFGWKIHAISVKFVNNRKYVKSALLDPYFYQFIHTKNSIRDYCYKCKFSDKHYSDIILADLWKEPSNIEIKINQAGTSLVLTNSSKGERIISEVADRLIICELSDNDGLYNIKRTDYPNEKIEEHNSYIRDYIKYGEIGAHKRHDKTTIMTKIKHIIGLYLKKQKSAK